MQANQKPVIWTTVIATIIILVIGFFSLAGLNSNLKVLGEKSDVDEAAIAAAVLAGITLPEWEAPEFPDTEKLDELWQTLFASRIDDLKDLVYSESGDERTLHNDFWIEFKLEFDRPDAREYVEDTLEDFDDFDGGFPGKGAYDEEEVGFEITQMGEVEAFNGITYYEDENSEVVVTLEYDFRYEKDDSDKVYKDTLYVTVEAEYDGEELEDLEVTYLL